nr:transposase, Ptta/En/Spm, transposase, Tnp1/En/Spm-like protein [Tanacetum cinerariifolium]
MEKDSEIYKGKKKRVKSISLKAKKESNDDYNSTSGSDDEEYAMAVRNFQMFFRRKGKCFRQPREEKKSFRHKDEKKGKNQKAFIGGSWSDSENGAEFKSNDETCLMAQSSNEWKKYARMMRQNKNLIDINFDALHNILKQSQRGVNDAMGLKKKTVVVTSDPLSLIAKKTKSDDKKVEKKDDEKKRDMSKVKCLTVRKK